MDQGGLNQYQGVPPSSDTWWIESVPGGTPIAVTPSVLYQYQGDTVSVSGKGRAVTSDGHARGLSCSCITFFECNPKSLCVAWMSVSTDNEAN